MSTISESRRGWSQVSEEMRPKLIDDGVPNHVEATTLWCDCNYVVQEER